MTSNETATNGWTAVPVDAGAIFNGRPYINTPEPISLDDIPFPSDDPIVAQVQEYAKKQLPRQTYNHSMRVFYFCEFSLVHPGHKPSNRLNRLRDCKATIPRALRRPLAVYARPDLSPP